jgi:hypothetical protein
MSLEVQKLGNVKDPLPEDIKNDQRVSELLTEGWRFHSNYNPNQTGNLEEVLRFSDSPYFHPKNAREILILDRAYDVFGRPLPNHRAVYMRDFKDPGALH